MGLMEDETVKGIIRISTLAALSAAAFLATTSALSCMSLPSGWYAEGNIGQSKQSNRNYGGGTSSQASGWGGSVDIGFKFMPYFGAEVGYSRYSNVNIKNSSGQSMARARLYSWDIAGKGIIPIVDSGFELFGKLGVARAYSKISLTNSDLVTSSGASFNTSQQTATALYIGAGADYSFLPNLSAVLQWARAKGNSNTGNLDLYSVGLNWIIG